MKIFKLLAFIAVIVVPSLVPLDIALAKDVKPGHHLMMKRDDDSGGGSSEEISKSTERSVKPGHHSLRFENPSNKKVKSSDKSKNAR